MAKARRREQRTDRYVPVRHDRCLSSGLCAERPGSTSAPSTARSDRSGLMARRDKLGCRVTASNETSLRGVPKQVSAGDRSIRACKDAWRTSTRKRATASLPVLHRWKARPTISTPSRDHAMPAIHRCDEVGHRLVTATRARAPARPIWPPRALVQAPPDFDCAKSSHSLDA